MCIRRYATALALAAVFVIGGSTPGRAQRLAPGAPILRSAEYAPSVLVGTVLDSNRLAGRAFVANLRVEATLVGESDTERQIAWEQPPSRTEPRLVPGQRLLIALERLPATSMWQRLAAGRKMQLVAGGGHAYVVDPDQGSLTSLQSYLDIDAAQRLSDAGSTLLAQIVAAGHPVLGPAALRRISELPSAPGAETVAILETVVNDTSVNRDLRIAVIRLIGERRLSVARPALDRLASTGSDLEPEALDAIAALDGGIDPASVEKLLIHPAARYRFVGARHARDALAERYLVRLVSQDPDPTVRAAAATTLTETKTSWGLAAAIVALGDPAGEVRSAAARAIARLGTPAVPALQAEIDNGTTAAPGAIAALAAMGAPGNSLLVEVARTHPNDQIRDIALLALGKVRGEH